MGFTHGLPHCLRYFLYCFLGLHGICYTNFSIVSDARPELLPSSTDEDDQLTSWNASYSEDRGYVLGWYLFISCECWGKGIDRIQDIKTIIVILFVMMFMFPVRVFFLG